MAKRSFMSPNQLLYIEQLDPDKLRCISLEFTKALARQADYCATLPASQKHFTVLGHTQDKRMYAWSIVCGEGRANNSTRTFLQMIEGVTLALNNFYVQPEPPTPSEEENVTEETVYDDYPTERPDF